MNDRTTKPLPAKKRKRAKTPETDMQKEPSSLLDRTVEIDHGLAMYRDSLKAAELEIADLGMGRPLRPKSENGEYFDGHLPMNINSFSIQKLGAMMTKMTIFADYVAGLRVRAKAEKQTAEEKLKLIKSKIRKTKSGTKEERDDLTITDVRFVIANAEVLTKVHSYEAILAREEAARRDIKTLSRLIEKEKISFEGNRRDINVNNPTRTPKSWK